MVVIKQQVDWDVQVSHVESAYINYISAATGFSPNEVHIDHIPLFHRLGQKGTDAAVNNIVLFDLLSRCFEAFILVCNVSVIHCRSQVLGWIQTSVFRLPFLDCHVLHLPFLHCDV